MGSIRQPWFLGAQAKYRHMRETFRLKVPEKWMPADPKVGARPRFYRLLPRPTPISDSKNRNPQKTSRWSQLQRGDEIHYFKQDHAILDFSDITDDLCPPGYTLERHDHSAIFYKLEIKNVTSNK